MSYELKTRKGHSYYTMSSMLQKAIRRGDAKHAAYAAGEIYASYPYACWHRLMTIAAEDCYGTISQEIYALYQSDMEVNKKRETNDRRSRIFVAKALVLLIEGRKSRDADYIACCLLDSGEVESEAQLIEEGFDEPLDEVPEYVFDVHTYQGKMNGKTKEEFAKAELEALNNPQPSLFEGMEWAWDSGAFDLAS